MNRLGLFRTFDARDANGIPNCFGRRAAKDWRSLVTMALLSTARSLDANDAPERAGRCAK
jgi:hypothetical protein